MIPPKESARATAREKRLADFPGHGTPPAGVACELLCEDNRGTYALPYLCLWSEGAWRNAGTGEPVEARVSNAIRNCPLCVMKNCPPRVHDLGWRWVSPVTGGGRRSRPEARHRRAA